jgi:hypothetical protein
MGLFSPSGTFSLIAHHFVSMNTFSRSATVLKLNCFPHPSEPHFIPGGTHAPISALDRPRLFFVAVFLLLALLVRPPSQAAVPSMPASPAIPIRMETIPTTEFLAMAAMHFSVPTMQQQISASLAVSM